MANGLNTTTQQMGPKPGLNIYNYGSGHIRTLIDSNGEPWWAVDDVLAALDDNAPSTTNMVITLGQVPANWRGKHQIRTASGTQEVGMFNEPGLFYFLARSDKPAAQPLQKWIVQTLPGIRNASNSNAKPKTVVASGVQSTLSGFHSTLMKELESLTRQNLILAALLDQATGVSTPSKYSQRNIPLDRLYCYAYEAEQFLGITRGKLLPFLRDQGILIWDSTTGYQPTTKYFHQGYFLSTPTSFSANSTCDPELQFTAKGRLWLFFNANRGWLTSILMRKVLPTLTTPVAEKPLPVTDFWLDLR